MKKGCITYVPGIVIEEVNDIMQEDKLKKKSKAFHEMVKYARVGREAGRIMRLKF